MAIKTNSKKLMSKFKTLPDLLNHVSVSFHDPRAINELQNGQWVNHSTEEIVNMIRAMAVGFHQMGLQKGETFGLYAPSSSTWVVIDMAILIAGGITVPIFANISTSGLEYIIKDAQMKFIFVEGEQTLKEIQPLVDRFEKIVLHSANHDEKNTCQFDDVIKIGNEALKKNPEIITTLMNRVSKDDVATYIYTSGSTGMPKGVELTNYNLVSQVMAAAELFTVTAGKDVALSCLPLAHIFERMVMYFYFSQGVSIFFADDVKNLATLLPQVKPTMLTVVPRLLEKVQAGIITKARNGSFIKRTIAHHAFTRAMIKDPTTPLSFFDKMYDAMVYKKIRNALGGNLECLISGGSALSKELCRFYLNMKIPVYQGYGMTECSPVIASSHKLANAEGFVGPAFPGVIIKIAENGEILVKGPGLMKCYHNKPEATAEVIDKEGWLHTGDKGELNDRGMLKITGRLKEIFKTSNGKYVSPVKLEQLLVTYYLIDMAMIIGENYKFVSCILFLDPNHLKKLKEKSNKVNMSNEEFVKEEEIVNKIDLFIKEMNKNLDHWEQIQKFHIATEVLTIEDGSLTPTLKIRRHVICERYKDIIEKMYKE